MLLYILVGSLLPYIEGLDSWLFEGTLDDPFEEVFLSSYFLESYVQSLINSIGNQQMGFYMKSSFRKCNI